MLDALPVTAIEFAGNWAHDATYANCVFSSLSYACALRKFISWGRMTIWFSASLFIMIFAEKTKIIARMPGNTQSQAETPQRTRETGSIYLVTFHQYCLHLWAYSAVVLMAWRCKKQKINCISITSLQLYICQKDVIYHGLFLTCLLVGQSFVSINQAFLYRKSRVTLRSSIYLSRVLSLQVDCNLPADGTNPVYYGTHLQWPKMRHRGLQTRQSVKETFKLFREITNWHLTNKTPGLHRELSMMRWKRRKYSSSLSTGSMTARLLEPGVKQVSYSFILPQTYACYF